MDMFTNAEISVKFRRYVRSYKRIHATSVILLTTGSNCALQYKNRVATYLYEQHLWLVDQDNKL